MSLVERAEGRIVCPRCKAKPGQKCTKSYRPESWRPPVKIELWRPHVERTRALTRLEVREAAKEQGVTQAELRRQVAVENARPTHDTDLRLALDALRAWDREEQSALMAWMLQHGSVLWEEPREASAGQEQVHVQ